MSLLRFRGIDCGCGSTIGGTCLIERAWRLLPGGWCVLLAAAVADPDRAIGRLDILTAGERATILREWNDTARISGEIAAVLMRHPAVAQAAVVAREEQGSRQLVGYVVPAADLVPAAEEMRAHVAACLPDYMVPSAYVVLERLPLTASGKLDRSALPAPEVTSVLRRAPCTPQEEVLCGLFAEVLGVERVGIDDNFFGLGGHSLLAMQLIGRIRSTLDTQIPIRRLFENPTVERLSRSIGVGYSQHSGFDALLPLRAAGNSRPLFCIHPEIGLSWSYSRLLQHIPPEHPIYGLQAGTFARPGNTPASIEEMAREYLHLIRSIQPVGPYNLLGWSFGGLVAHAIATQLQSEGQEIALLALVDSYPRNGAIAPLSSAIPDAPVRALRCNATEGELCSMLLDLQRAGHAPFMLKAKDLDVIRAVVSNNVRLVTTFPRRRFVGEALMFTAANIDAQPPVDSWRHFIAGRLVIHSIDCVHERMMDAWPASEIGRVLASEFGRQGHGHLRREGGQLGGL